MRKIIILLLLFSAIRVHSQSDLLAKNYFEQGEYEKALVIYTKLHNKNSSRFEYFTALVATHQQLENFKEAETILLERINSRMVIPQLYVELGFNYSLQEKDSLATLNYNKAIELLETKIHHAANIGATFEKYSLLNQAVETYESSMEINPERDFNYQLARLYGEQGEIEKMFSKYLDLIKSNNAYRSIAQRNFSLYVTEDPTNEANILLRKVLLQKLQNQPNIMYNELLSWLTL